VLREVVGLDEELVGGAGQLLQVLEQLPADLQDAPLALN